MSGTSAGSKLWRTLLPAPGLSVVLCLTWLMLNESLSAGHLLLGAGLALVLPWFTRGLRTPGACVRSWRTVWCKVRHLAVVVLLDIVKSNVDVARLVLGPEDRLQPRFVWLPLAISNPRGIAALASIITLTPGTVSAELSADHRWLLVHALHCPDERAAAALVQVIKTRYEQPLLEIFE
jgi:multicomponent K+:H+ antiporter subunit E